MAAWKCTPILNDQALFSGNTTFYNKEREGCLETWLNWALEIGRLSWVIFMSPKCNHKYPYGKEAQGDFPHTEKKVMWRQTTERFKDATTSILVTIKSQKRQGADSTPGVSGKRGVVLLLLWYGPSVSDLRLLVPKTMKEYISFVLSHQVCGNLLQQP